MLGGIVKRDRLIQVRPAFRDVPPYQQGSSHEAMPDHQRGFRPLLFREHQELRREIATDIAIEGHKVRYPEGVEDREQQQGIFGRLAQRFSLLDQQTCLLRSRPGFGGGIAFDMHEWGDQRDLKLDLLVTQRRRAGQDRDLVEGVGELGRGFDQRRACQ